MTRPALIGIPWVDGGRDRDGCDCYGLVFLFFGQVLGIALPSYAETPAADLLAGEHAVGEALSGSTWRAVSSGDADRGDVVLMRGVERGSDRRLRHSVRHVGVLLDRATVLHVERGIGSVALPRSHPTIRPRIVAFYRHRNLA